MTHSRLAYHVQIFLFELAKKRKQFTRNEAGKIFHFRTNELFKPLVRFKTKGVLTDGRAQDITLHKTQLNGTKFNGRATTLLQEGSYEGRLFGNGAKEAAGIATFSGDSSYNTSFGGIRY